MSSSRIQALYRWLPPLVAVALFSACASVPPPDNLMARAGQQLETAAQAGAKDYAPVDLNLARNRYQEAQTAMQLEKYAQASDKAEESLADGRLAQVRAELGATRHKIRTQKTENARLRARLLGAPSSSRSNGGLPEQITLPNASNPASASSTDGGQP